MSGPRLVRAWRARHDQMAAVGDAGTSMIELFVAMIIMTVCGSIFIGAIVTLFRASNQAQAVTNSAQQTNQAYQTLDRTVRYAAAISSPGRGAGTGDLYVELRNTTDGTERCSQLRLDIASGQLQRRTWRTSDMTTLSAWLPLTSGLSNAASTTATTIPFTLTAPRHQVLLINLIAKAGVGSASVSSQSSFRLTALNSPITSNTATASGVCQQAGRP